MRISYSNNSFTITAANANASIEFQAEFVSLSGPSVYLCEVDFKHTNERQPENSHLPIEQENKAK